VLLCQAKKELYDTQRKDKDQQIGKLTRELAKDKKAIQEAELKAGSKKVNAAHTTFAINLLTLLTA
jgi:hypothetical protein